MAHDAAAVAADLGAAKPADTPLWTGWQALKTAAPGLRARDGAARLGVSEAELVAAVPALEP